MCQWLECLLFPIERDLDQVVVPSVELSHHRCTCVSYPYTYDIIKLHLTQNEARFRHSSDNRDRIAQSVSPLYLLRAHRGLAGLVGQ
jgi:hypothetical protein